MRFWLRSNWGVKLWSDVSTCQCVGKKWRRLLGLSFMPEEPSCHPVISSQWPSAVSCRCLVGSSLDFSDAGGQTFQLLWWRKCRRPIIKFCCQLHLYHPEKSYCMQDYAITYLLLLLTWLCLFLCFLLSLAASFSTVEGPAPQGHKSLILPSPYSVCKCDYQSPSADDGPEMPHHNITSLGTCPGWVL